MGIDLNTSKLAIVSLDIDGLDFSVNELKSKNKDWLVRLHDLQGKFEEYIKKENSIDYIIEDVPYVVNKQSYYKLVSILAMCRVLLHQHNKNYKVIHNSTWKSKTGVRAKIFVSLRIPKRILKYELSRFSVTILISIIKMLLML